MIKSNNSFLIEINHLRIIITLKQLGSKQVMLNYHCEYNTLKSNICFLLFYGADSKNSDRDIWPKRNQNIHKKKIITKKPKTK